jgi:phosphoribosylaminoimidazole (AIR) synthetase
LLPLTVSESRSAYRRSGVDVTAGERAVELRRAHVDSTRRPESAKGALSLVTLPFAETGGFWKDGSRIAF